MNPSLLLPRSLVLAGGAAALATLVLVFAPGAADAAPNNFLFVGDLKTGTLLRYNADPAGSSLALTPYGLNGNLSDPAYITGQGVTEGVHGTGNTLITTQHLGNEWHISRFDRNTGAFIGYVSTQTFGGIGNIALTKDASTVYVPDETNGILYRIDVATGNVLSSVSMPGVHDVQIGPDGFIYAAGYSTNTGVVRFTANLGSPVQVVLPDANGLHRPAGMTISGNTLYVAQNSQTINAQIYQYTLNGAASATYNTQVTSSLLSFSFGLDMGPDNNLYVAVPGSYTGQGGPNQVVKLDLSNGFSQANTAVTSAILYSGTNPSTTYQGTATSVIWPKYLKFSTNFAIPNDPGYLTVVPESGTLPLLLAGALPLAGMLIRRRRKVD